MTIAVLGTGNVGGTLGKAFASVGHGIFFGQLRSYSSESLDISNYMYCKRLILVIELLQRH